MLLIPYNFVTGFHLSFLSSLCSLFCDRLSSFSLFSFLISIHNFANYVVCLYEISTTCIVMTSIIKAASEPCKYTVGNRRISYCGVHKTKTVQCTYMSKHNHVSLLQTRGSHSDGYEEFCLLEYNVQSTKSQPTFQKKQTARKTVLLDAWFMLFSCLAHSSTTIMTATCSCETLLDFQRSTWRCIAEDRNLQASLILGTRCLKNSTQLTAGVLVILC
jgi:hypothetical protein